MSVSIRRRQIHPAGASIVGACEERRITPSSLMTHIFPDTRGVSCKSAIESGVRQR
ncbi:hypothetical protein IE81DRAFT_326895 [Ceraceosorus guamensis]|uniref:Uncharacterized protein n=1 Tax=Ceraceosorus guamensis TaxID=1522189 RepID=A0A316VSA9_9BASI|nr:hypothetical protein IE81DRAFT_326895 [Ceraceosorus guamensis]PWN39071.1 hypothetical protein IE81DRAFT_326895 [Ceraceosorus guamensis]